MDTSGQIVTWTAFAILAMFFFVFVFWIGGSQVELVFVWLQVSVFDLGKVAEIICVQYCYLGLV